VLKTADRGCGPNICTIPDENLIIVLENGKFAAEVPKIVPKVQSYDCIGIPSMSLKFPLRHALEANANNPLALHSRTIACCLPWFIQIIAGEVELLALSLRCSLQRD